MLGNISWILTLFVSVEFVLSTLSSLFLALLSLSFLFHLSNLKRPSYSVSVGLCFFFPGTELRYFVTIFRFHDKKW